MWVHILLQMSTEGRALDLDEKGPQGREDFRLVGREGIGPLESGILD